MSVYQFPNEPNDWPQLNRCERDGHSLVLDLFVPERMSYFAGHFPDQPVLPGVVQVFWAERAARDCLGLTGAVSIRSLKFKQMVLPNTALVLSLVANPGNGSVSFTYASDATQYSSGKFKGAAW
jgi:3-hydroxymyristoyl/3-hydroxydecanoyl-(acyl carrier protein) dehydratase